jgi:sialic acid synthase SpsE
MIENEKDFYFIAEIGTNFYEVADILKVPLVNAAKAMIIAFSLMNINAEKKRVHAIKFQIFNPDKTAHPIFAKDQYEYMKNHSLLSEKDWRHLAEFCKERDVDFMATFFDEELVERYQDLVKVFKVASPDITNYSLLEKINEYEKPVILSTGAATTDEIKSAIKTLNKSNVIPMHCIVNYNFSDKTTANLSEINELKKLSNSFVGYSDHYRDCSLLDKAYLVGARILEKHVVLHSCKKNKFNNLNDFAHSATQFDLKKKIDEIIELSEILYNNGELFDDHSNNFRLNARRGIYTAKEIKAGKKIEKEDICLLRPRKNSFPDSQYNVAIKNMVAKVDVEKGRPIFEISKKENA